MNKLDVKIVGAGLAFVALLALVACGARVDTRSQPVVAAPMAVASGVEPFTKISIDDAGSYTVLVREVCYDGIVYLFNSKGGMTPKVDRSSLNATINYTPSPFLGCK